MNTSSTITNAENDLRDFFRRSVAARTATGIPKSFEVQVDAQQFNTSPFRRGDDPEQPRKGGEGNVLVPPSNIDSFYPYWSYYRGGLTCDIYGSGFTPQCSVQFDGHNAASVTFINSRHIEAVTADIGDVPYVGYITTPGVSVSNVTPFNPAFADTLCCFQYETFPTAMQLNGNIQQAIQAPGRNFVGFAPVNGSVIWPLDTGIDRTPVEPFPFIGIIQGRVYRAGTTPGGFFPVALIINGECDIKVTTQFGTAGQEWWLDLWPEPTFGGPVFQWDYILS